MRPYYQDGSGIIIYHGDCREVLPSLAPVDVIITDPVWPNAVAELAGGDDPAGLFAEAAAHFPRLAKRLVVQLGCDSDPRFLRGVPASLPFIRSCWLSYSVPVPKGRVLHASDVAYAFGSPPPSRPGRHLISGECLDPSPKGKQAGHPCARRLRHVRWLVKWFTDGRVLDPFCGIGTTLLAAKDLGYPAVGIEIEERFCETAARRLSQSVFNFEEADAHS